MSEQAETLAETILNSDLPAIQYLTPETKGRILFDLLTAPYTFSEKANDWLTWDTITDLSLTRKREQAAFRLLRYGIQSARDWQETMEHVGTWKEDILTFALPPGATTAEKAKRARRNEQEVRTKLIPDNEAWQELQLFIGALKALEVGHAGP